MTTTGRVTFKGVPLGDHAVVNTDYDGNVTTRIIPRGKGVKIRSTEENGGGVLNITIRGAISRSKRVTVEEYFLDIDDTFDPNVPGDLIITSEDIVVTLTDCYLKSFNQGEGHNKLENFTASFVKSI